MSNSTEINYKKEFMIMASIVLGTIAVSVAVIVGGLLWLLP